MRITRRNFVSGSAAIGASAAFPQFVSLARSADGFLEIVTQPSEKKLYREDGPVSQLWTYNGVSPGPEIRVKKGERVKVRLVNKLEEPTSIHWHGIRIENAMDGVSGLTQEAVKPGDTFEYDFVVPDAGTYWYHAHNKSWNQVERGLYGPLIVEDTNAFFDPDHDLTLLIDDWRLDSEGKLDVASFGSMMDWSHAGRLGNWLTVNGESLPEFKLNAGETYRLRLINASNARIFAIDPNRFDAKILAFDGQALPQAAKPSKMPLQIAPAQRVDLLVVPKAEADFPLEEVSSAEAFEFVKFKVLNDGTAATEKAAVSITVNSLPEPDTEAPQKFVLVMTGGAMGNMAGLVYDGKELNRETIRSSMQFWGLNGVANISESPFFSVGQGTDVVIEMDNQTAFPHAMHTHGHHFRVVGNQPSDVWRDTVIISPDEKLQVAFVADNPGKWLLHCHMLEHAAAGMNTWFEVV